MLNSYAVPGQPHATAINIYDLCEVSLPQTGAQFHYVWPKHRLHKNVTVAIFCATFMYLTGLRPHTDKPGFLE